MFIEVVLQSSPTQFDALYGKTDGLFDNCCLLDRLLEVHQINYIGWIEDSELRINICSLYEKIDGQTAIIGSFCHFEGSEES